jgi:hypothetical protein
MTTVKSAIDWLKERHVKTMPMQQILQERRLAQAAAYQLTPIIPPALQPAMHCTHCRHGILHISSENAAVATRLRFLSPKLLAALKQHPDLKAIYSIQYHVKTTHKTSAPANTQQPKRKPLSARSSALIKQAASRTPYEPLKASLLKLSEP